MSALVLACPATNVRSTAGIVFVAGGEAQGTGPATSVKRLPAETRLGYLAAYLRSFTGQEPSDADVAHFSTFVMQARSRQTALK
ncbi:hypothetical protein FJW07_17465 [Mesorhizobium sp. B3-1-9]|nr:hypothetical protein FJW07_17465 [Mesorhizobium sp. B3-1-9]